MRPDGASQRRAAYAAPLAYDRNAPYPELVHIANPNRPSVFEARGVTKIYRMGEVEVHALRGVDLDLYEQEFLVLLGASGSGKSTLLNILGGLDVPTAGTVRYGDKELTAFHDA